jgi:hypothetical protein
MTKLSSALNGVAIDEPHPCRDSRPNLIILIIASHVAGPIASELGMANPNFYPRHGGHGAFVAADDHADLCDLEQSEAGPAGTVIAFNLGTLHRGTAVTKPRGARYTMHLGYRPAQVEWANGRPGPTAAMHPIGTGSCTRRRHGSSSSWDSRRPDIPSGIHGQSWG